MQHPIQNKVVVITGASSGIGAATARHLASFGAAVVLGARRLDRLNTIAGEIRAAGGKAAVAVTDVRKLSDVSKLVDCAVATFGRVDVMVNNAGLRAIAPLSEGKVDEWEAMIDINIKGLLYGINAALPVFQEQGSGHFINICSIAGHKVFSPGGTVYSGTKFAVRAISEGLRYEVGNTIRTTMISPGAVDTELRYGSSQSLDAFYDIAMPAEAMARAVAYAIEQPGGVDINEIMLRPTPQAF
ncbi:SDR family oxidoreductase [Janthinobacterium agaricidamnosum]|uniref:Short chain dehydrogenase family protein n=1 Tax=Janthinobacterium agaricidamnosum NBRC 102515 = DSM 9628 TaxID=1349767 RepID=W0VE98_9BURK|nr:SDR family oxidoreductase [Janthinobacterium agaricidamnosum]CDG86010.1 short chain dehydrogenase family protein [Janthinobacterium agaricidamnosum NBRC 102515 = DSM 9628]